MSDAATGSARHPNIVFILVDQMAHDCIAALGNDAIQTPNLDRLANEGVAFQNAYCNSPVCAPSRASLASGKLIRTCEVFDNAAQFSSEIPTIMHHLSAAGYDTVGSGKFHFVGPDQLHGFSRRLTTDVFPSNFAWTPNWDAGPIFSEGMNASVAKQAGPVSWNKYLDFDSETLFRALEYIRSVRRMTPGRPFFLNVSFSHPHPPFQPMEEYLALYDDVPGPRVPNLPREPNTYEQWMITYNGLDHIELTSDEVVRARRCYYAMVSYIDDLVGRIVQELERHRLLDDTMIVFTSDHGEMLGEHGLWYKRTYHEESVRVPLVMRMPGGEHGGRAIDDVVSLVDLSAALLDAAGVAVSSVSGLDGDSLMPLVRGEDVGWKDTAIFEYFGNGTVEPMLGVRRGSHKLVEVPGACTLLFDLSSDPHELSDQADDSSKAELVAELRDVALGGIDVGRLRERIVHRQRRRLALNQLYLKTGPPKWDYEPFFDASRMYVRPTGA
jgi:choline-sulfatase